MEFAERQRFCRVFLSVSIFGDEQVRAVGVVRGTITQYVIKRLCGRLRQLSMPGDEAAEL